LETTDHGRRLQADLPWLGFELRVPLSELK
jgi:hypothetical protein